jgi:molecular chaperone GrpE
VSGDTREPWEEVPADEARDAEPETVSDPPGETDATADPGVPVAPRAGGPDEAGTGEGGPDASPGDDSSPGDETSPGDDARPGDDAIPGEGTEPRADPAGDPADLGAGEGDGDVAGEVDLLGQALRERDDYLDALRHLRADFENYRKRVAKQQADLSAHAAESLVEKLIPALDVADLAVVHGASGEVEQVWKALLDALEREGLGRIEPTAGQSFDPNLHEAVSHEEGDGGGQEVVDLLRAGYSWKGRVLRPAMVKVRG